MGIGYPLPLRSHAGIAPGDRPTTPNPSMNIYVGNLAYATTEEELNELFSQYGTVSAVRVVHDRVTQRSKGFGFVEMPDEAQARAAIDAINGREVGGRPLRVNESQPRPDRPPRRPPAGGTRW